jgi:hypothetical protein
VELLWWEGCPSTERALAELRSAVAEFGLDGNDVELREIRTDEEAVAREFAGSPTILIDGVELMTLIGRGGGGEPVGLNCRVYHRHDGRVSPTPDPEDVRRALALAVAGEGGQEGLG